jgi:RNA polymerase sigma-70 factor, ECF subfamily
VSKPALQIVEPMPVNALVDLVALARAGDGDAIERLVAMHLPDMHAVTARILRDRGLAQDAAHDAMLNVLKALHHFRGEASFRTWVLRIAVNSARSLSRRRTRRREVPLEIVAEQAEADSDAAAHVVVMDEARRAAALLDTLPEKQRLTVSLRVQQGLSYREIGDVLNCTEGAARVNYHLGVKRLRELMK